MSNSVRQRLERLEADAGEPAGSGWDLSRLTDEELHWMRSLYVGDTDEPRELMADEQVELARLERICRLNDEPPARPAQEMKHGNAT